MSAVTLTDNEKYPREQFVGHYMREFDPLHACLRMGYGEQTGKSVAAQFMEDPYVLARIDEEKDKLGICTEEEVHRRRIIAGLYRIASNKNASPSAQVGAFAQLSKIFGLEAPLRTDTTIHGAEEMVFRIVDATVPDAS